MAGYRVRVSALAHVSDDALNRAYLRLLDTDPLFRHSEAKAGEGGMSPGQEQFHRDPASRRLLRAATQIGKTRAGSVEMWWAMLDRHPYRAPSRRPTAGWIVLPDLNDWPKVCKKIREVEPPDARDPACHYDTAKGYTYRGARGLMARNGSLALPKSGTQQQTALAGDTLDWLWFDEPPRESHWGESLSRLAVNGGSAWLTFTPIGKPLAWLKTYLHGNPETSEAGHPEWSETLITLTHANVPHRTEENIAAQIAEYSAWEYAQRVEGAWAGVTKDRWLSGFSEACVVDPDPMPSMERIGIGIDHGEGSGKEVAILVGYDGFRLWALDEYSAAANSTPAMDADAILKMLTRWGLSPFQVSICRGDTNSMGKGGSGLSVNAALEIEFSRLTQVAAPPFRIEIAQKGKGSVDAGLRAMNAAFVSGRCAVLPGCTRLIHSARHWRGKGDSGLKDCLDAFRYVAMDFLANAPRGSGKLRMV